MWVTVSVDPRSVLISECGSHVILVSTVKPREAYWIINKWIDSISAALSCPINVPVIEPNKWTEVANCQRQTLANPIYQFNCLKYTTKKNNWERSKILKTKSNNSHAKLIKLTIDRKYSFGFRFSVRLMLRTHEIKQPNGNFWCEKRGRGWRARVSSRNRTGQVVGNERSYSIIILLNNNNRAAERALSSPRAPNPQALRGHNTLPPFQASL